MTKNLIRISVLLLLLGFPSSSEQAWRSVAGVVTDKAGNTLQGSVVQLENDADLAIRSYITGVDGRYHFTEVSYDIDYTLKAHYLKYWSKAKTLSCFNSAAHSEIDLIIPIE